ncbi:MAG: ABC transporter substrate-binding protein [Bacillota bacterium]
MKRLMKVLALASVLALVLSGCGGQQTQQPAGQATAPAASAAPIKVKVSQPVDSLLQMELYVARGKGYFKEQGLEVEQISTNGGGPDTAALLAGEVQFNVASDTYHIDLQRQGKKTLGVFNYQNKNVVTWAIHKDAAAKIGITETTPLKEKLPKLKGLRIGITKPGALTDKVARYYVQRAGLDPDRDVQIIGVGSGPTAVAALEQKKIDVLVVSVPQPEMAIQKGFAIHFMGVGEDTEFGGFLMSTVRVMEDWANQNPETVKKFVAAVQKASEFVQSAPPEEIAEVIAPYLKDYDKDLLLAGVRQVKLATNPTGRIQKEWADNTVLLMGVTDIKGEDVFKQFTDKYITK